MPSVPDRREQIEDVGVVRLEGVPAVEIALRRIVRHARERDRVRIAVELVVVVVVLLVGVATGDRPVLVEPVSPLVERYGLDVRVRGFGCRRGRRRQECQEDPQDDGPGDGRLEVPGIPFSSGSP